LEFDVIFVFNMKVDKETVAKIAHLSRLELKNADLDKMQKDLSNTLEWVDKLNELNTDNIEPLVSMSDNQNIMREDVTKEHISHNDALKNAPKKDSDYIRVPKVLD